MALKKNLANCTPEEFLVQTNKIRKAAEKWLKLTDIIAIRKNIPVLEPIPVDAGQDEVEAIMKRHEDAVRDAGFKNLNAILDSVMGDHPKETVELLAHLCFVDPSKANDHKISEYLKNLTEILNDEAVLGFFTSLIRLERINILSA
jgi:hypothetical protein